MSFSVTTFTTKKRERCIRACMRCRKLRRKCVMGSAHVCTNCEEKQAVCEWAPKDTPKPETNTKQNRDVFANMLKNNDHARPQFVCSTQPLASLLSRDSFLFFDGDSYGLYYPWRNQYTAQKQVDPEYRRYLTRKGAFDVPSFSEQRRLGKLFLDNLYALYPVVNKDFLQQLSETPLLLLNGMFLLATRFDDSLDPKQIRSRLSQIFERCKLLETIESNKVVLIQAYVLLSAHEEGLDGNTSSKEYIAKACNLCGELAITNMGGASNTDVRIPALVGASDNSFPRKLDETDAVGECYSHKLLTRVLWTTYCCDRVVSATSGREMVFNRADWIVDEISMAHFDEGPDQEADFVVFRSWLEIAIFVERIQAAMYRPPNNRSVDLSLYHDISKWEVPPTIISPRIHGFLHIAHCYAGLLFLRSEIDSISFLLGNPEPEKAPGNKILELKLLSRKALSLLDTTPDIVHSVVVVHVVLHVISLVQFEAKLAKASGRIIESEDRDSSIISQCISRLESLKDYWWFADTALAICEMLLMKK